MTNDPGTGTVDTALPFYIEIRSFYVISTMSYIHQQIAPSLSRFATNYGQETVN